MSFQFTEAPERPPDARVFGYARASTSAQVNSVPRQIEDITRRAETVPGQFIGCYHDIASAERYAWTERTNFKRLCGELRKGDSLIVWRLDRLDRNPFRAVECLRWLADQGIYLYVLEFAGVELNLESATGRLLAFVIVGVSEFFAEQKRQSVLDGLRRIKNMGFLHPVVGRSLPGQRVEKILVGEELKPRRAEPSPDHKYVRYIAVWDAEQCALVRECWIRWKYMGHKDKEIGRDFYLRRLRAQDGASWVDEWWGRRNGKEHYRVKDYRRIKAARLLFQELYEKGELPPEMQINDQIIKKVIAAVGRGFPSGPLCVEPSSPPSVEPSSPQQ